MQGMDPQQLQFLDIRVRREHLLADALSQILMRASDLKKPLRVTFLSGGVPEEGLDQGGVTKASPCYSRVTSEQRVCEHFGGIPWTCCFPLRPESLKSVRVDAAL